MLFLQNTGKLHNFALKSVKNTKTKTEIKE